MSEATITEFNDALKRSTGFLSVEESKAMEGRKIYGRNRACVGKVRRVSYRQCAVCGWHSCLIVDWEEGTSRKMTKPCTCGVKENPDGSLEII